MTDGLPSSRVRVAAVALILLLLPLLLPAGAASSHAWSIDARVRVLSETEAEYTWTLDGITRTNLTLPVPDGARFVGSRDATGALRTDEWTHPSLGEVVSVHIEARAPTIAFELAGERDGPFSLFAAQVAADADSDVTVALALPAGWTLAGYRTNDDGDAPDARGVFHQRGPAYVQLLVLPDAVHDLGADPTISGPAVKRHAAARVGTDGVDWRLTTTYDTDVYRREWDVPVPEGATLVGASTPFGALDASLEGDVVKLRTPYPVGYGLGARSFTVDLRLPAPDAYGGAFRESNLSIHAADGDVITMEATLAPGLRAAGARVAGGVEVAPLRFAAAGPLSVTIPFLPAAAPGHVQFTEGSFVVDVPLAREAAARETARRVSALLPEVADFAYPEELDRPFFVAYTDAPVFGWEEGFYSNGLNTISIRVTTLDEGASLEALSVLVHEATHGLLDRRLADAPRGLSLLHEGLARLAETRLEQGFDDDEIVRCEAGFCRVRSARPAANATRDFYASGRALDPAWGAGSVASSEERAFLYDHSGLVFHAYDTWAPEGALENALAHLDAATFTDEPDADARTVVGILLANAPGTTEEALLHPGRVWAARSLEQFRYCMGELVAPRFPGERATAPPGGCPAPGYGGSDAPLPPPPVVEEEAPPALPSPTAVAPTRPTFVVPTSFPEEAPGEDDAPAGVVERGLPSAPTPGAGLPLLLVAVAALATLTSRRSR